MRANAVRGLILMLLAMLLSGCGYNTIQQKDEAVDAAWSQVINVYQRRADLVPNLVAAVKGYASHERQVLTDVTQARSRVGSINVDAGDAGSLQQFQQAQGELQSAISRLLVVVENYPQLKADQNSCSCRRSWKAPRTGSRSSASAISRRCRSTTPTSAGSRSTSPR